MMETEQAAASCPPPGQAAVRTWLSPSTRAPASDATSRFHGDGVRYKAKLIGVDPVPDAQGEKMCWDSMMKLKGFEAAGRKQGKHKQRVWLKVCSSGLKIVDERTGAVIHHHDRSRISSLRKDESDPRALAYVYQHEDTFILFYIKIATLADPVLTDINEVCQTPEEPAEAPTQVGGNPSPTSSLLPLNDSSTLPAEGPALEDVFSPRPDSSSGQPKQASSSDELMEIFSIPMKDPLMPVPNSSNTVEPESPKPMLSSAQILSMFPTQPVGSAYASPPYSPTNMPWGQQGPLGNQWAGQAAAPVAPWPSVPASMGAWAPAGIAAPPAGGQFHAPGSEPGVMLGGGTPASPPIVSGHPTPLNSPHVPAGASEQPQSASDILDQSLLLL